MKIFTEIIGNLHSPEWKAKLESAHIESIFLDQWTAQKSRFLARSDHNNEYPVALRRQSQITDGDILSYDPESNEAIVLRLQLTPVLEIDLSKLESKSPDEIIRISVELGHAIGNQHWPAVVKGTKVYVPLTVDKKVMLSVMKTHHIDDITYQFHQGQEIIPYMAPHEIRRLFGGASHGNHVHDAEENHIHHH